MADNVVAETGSGSPLIFHFEQFHDTLNKLYQQDLYQQKQIRDAATRSQVELAQGAKGIRTPDIEKYTNYYNGMKQASLMLQNPKVMADAKLRTYWQTQQNDNFIGGLAFAEKSKEHGKFENEVPQQMMRDKNVGWDENALQTLNTSKSLPVDDAIAAGLNTPVHYLAPQDVIPRKEVDAHVLGGPLVRPTQKPKLDAHGNVMSYDKYRLEGFKNSANEAAANALQVPLTTPSMKGQIKAEFETDRQTLGDEKINAKIKEAEDLVGHPLPRDAYGYFAANYALKTKPQEIFEGNVPDHDYEKRQQWAHEDRNNAIRMAHSDQLQRNAFAHTDAKLAASKSNSDLEPFDATPMHTAALNGDRATVEKYGTTIAQNTNKQFLTVSRADILDPNRRRKLTEALGVDYANDVTKTLPNSPKSKDAAIQVILNKINKIAGTQIKLDDIGNGKIIPVFMANDQIPNKNEAHNPDGTYTNVKTFKVYNPNVITPLQLNSDISNEYRKKNKWQAAQQQKVLLSDMNSELNDD